MNVKDKITLTDVIIDVLLYLCEPKILKKTKYNKTYVKGCIKKGVVTIDMYNNILDVLVDNIDDTKIQIEHNSKLIQKLDKYRDSI